MKPWRCISAVGWMGALLLSLAAQAAPMGNEDARHLLSRSGFGASPEEIAAMARLSRRDGVERLLAGAQQNPLSPPPEDVVAYLSPKSFREAEGEAKKELLRLQRQRGVRLRGWWVAQMLATPSPLTEHMTLFWHNHFVSSLEKVKSPALMAEQNLLLRRYALGNFADMLHAVAKGPAMLVYLDTANSRKGQPNENFAREVMELFTLGEGHYDEHDIKEAARAFTGWSVAPETGAYKWRPFIHDDGVKTVLGQQGNFDGDAVLDILLARPETAEFVTNKLWKEFVSPEPDARQVKRIAAGFRTSGYDIKTVLRGLFMSPAFWARENRAALVKSPVDWVVGTARSLDMRDIPALPTALALRQLGQDLFAPPNVKGWPGGDAWINSNSLLARKQLVERLLRGEESSGAGEMAMRAAESGDNGDKDDRERQRMARALAAMRFDLDRWNDALDKAHLSPETALLSAAPAGAPLDDSLPLRERVKTLLLDPVSQLK
ncbi:MAG: DUF1800 domain-containing protein [Rhodocyclaceae bacterium]|nr:MAG: DUF1800 domain-containing protein [Rhodocyclaceae bacterium]